MLSRLVHTATSITWLRSIETVIAVAILGIAGVAAAAVGAPVALRHGRWVRQGLRTRGIDVDCRLPVVALLAFCLGDWALLRVLPILRLSFSTEIILPLAASILVRLMVLSGMVVAQMLVIWRRRRHGLSGSARPMILLFVLTNLAFSAVQVDAYVVEPLWPDTTSLSLAFDSLDPAAPPVRVVHLTDTHIERSSYREARIV